MLTIYSDDHALQDGKAELRPLEVGDWFGDGWFVNEGLAPGDRLEVASANTVLTILSSSDW